MSPIITNLVTLYTATTEGTFCFTGVCGYDYNISVVDANNCYEDRINVETISLVCPLTINVTNIVNPTCSGSTNGSFTVTPNGGVSPYSYSAINNNIIIIQNNSNFTGLISGNWNIYVQDSLGNSANTTAILSTTGINPFIIIPKYSANTICLGTNVITFGSPTEYIITTSQGGSAEVSTTSPVNLCFSLTGCGVETITVCPKEFIYTPLYRFGSDPNDGGSYPRTGVIRHTNGLLYGVSQDGGLNNGGSIYRTNIFNTAYSIRHNFSNGSQPVGELVQYPLTSSGNMYGVTLYGGTLNQGTIYRINSTGGGHQILHNFSGQTYGDGANPNASLLIVNDTIYGTTLNGGTNNRGVIFSLTLSGTYTILHHFTGTTSILARSELILDSNILYGNDSTGVLGAAKNTIFSYNLGTSQFNSYNYGTTLTFTYGGGLTKGSNGLFYGTSFNGGISGNGVLYTCSTINNAGIFYQNPNISPTYGKLMEAPNGYLYGVTYYGGLGSNGQIYKIDLQGNNFEIIFNNFSVTGGTSPSGVLFHSGGYLYGTTSANGVSNKGSIFKIATEDCCEEYTIDLSLGIKPEIYLSYINYVRNLCIYVEPNSLFQAPVTGYTVSLNGNVFGYIPTGSTDCFSFPGCDPIDVKFCTDSTQTCCYEKSFNYSGGTNIAGISNSIQFFSGSPYVCIDIDETTFLPPPYTVTITGNTITGGTYSYNTGLTANCYTIIGCGDLNLEIVSLSLSGSGCTYNTILNVPCQEPLSLTTIGFSNPCFDNSGFISVLANGGSPNYTYELINWFGQIITTLTGGTNEVITFSNLGAATYYVQVIDNRIPVPDAIILEYNLSNLIVTTNVVTATTGNTVCLTVTSATINNAVYFVEIENTIYPYDNNISPNCFPVTACGLNSIIIYADITYEHGYTILHTFSGISGDASPRGSLIIANNGILYGMAGDAIFSCTTTGNYGVIHNAGSNLFNSLVQANNGVLYGMTNNGGQYSLGTIFSCTTSGDYGVIHTFSGTSYGDGENPFGNLIQTNNGVLYGMTADGGQYGSGTIFSCTTSGDYGIIHNFLGFPSDGSRPLGSSLIQSNNGLLYGMTSEGGQYNFGTIFSCSTNGGYGIIYNFSGSPDGVFPWASLIEVNGNYLYGTTTAGGQHGWGTIFKISNDGQDYQIIHNFSGFTDGATPRGTLFQSSNGLIYGMTYGGGQYGLGTIFTIDQSDNYQIIYNFSGDTYSDGAGPYYTSFMEGNDGVLYAMTSSGGIGDRGIIFSLVSTGTTGCTFSRTVNVPCVFPPLGFEFINSTLYCCDTPINNARFTVKATGGTGNYSYLLSGITTNSSFNPTSVNPVTDIATFVNITGACENTDWLIIVTDIGQNPPQQLISNVITLNPTFNVNVTFTINSAIVTINGLTNTSNTGQVIINNQIVGNNLFDGTYTYPISCGTNNQVVVNAIQFEVPPSSVVCSYSASSFIPCPFFCDYSFDPIVCPGDTVDLFTVFITGGTPPYTITLTSTNIAPPLSFSTGTTNTTFIFDNTFPGGFAMPAGTWTLTVTTSPPFDSCVNTFTIAPTFNVSIIETNSTGFCFTVSGGTQPYEITLDGFTYPIYFNDGTHCLSANCGTHTLFIDNLFNLPTNCPITLNFNIPCAPLSCNVSTVDPNCGQDDGSILVLINGGTAPYTIDVTGPNGYSDTQVTSALSYPFQNLDNGTYIVTVTDFGGQPCVNTVTLTDSFTLNVTVQPINYSIGEICFNISGGLPPYTILLNYSFAWSGTPTSPTQDICLTATCGVNTSYLVFDSTQPCFVQLPTPFQIIEDSGFYDSNKWNYGISFTNCSPLTANTSVGNGSFTYTGITTGGGCQTNATAIQNTVTPNIFGGVIPTSITYQFQLNYGVNYSFFVPSGFAVPYIETPFNSIFDNTTRLMPSPTSAIPPIPSGTDFNNQVFTGTITIPTTVIPTVLSGYGITTALSGGYGVVAQSQYTGFQLSILSYTVDCECAISGNTTIPCLSTPTIGIVSIVNPGCDETANGIITVSGNSGQPPYTYSATNGTISYTSTNGIFTGLISGTWYLSLVDNLGAAVSLPSPITLTETFYANIVMTPLGFCVTITGGTPDYLVYLDNTPLSFSPSSGSNTVCYTAECGTTSIITVRDSG